MMENNTHKRIAWLVIGFISLGLGTIGILLPLLPTTPFVLVSAFSFAKSSERCHMWLINHKVFGKMIKNWEEHGAISRYAKIASTVSIVAVFALSIIMAAPKIVTVIQFFVLGGALTFIWSRPLPPNHKNMNDYNVGDGKC